MADFVARSETRERIKSDLSSYVVLHPTLTIDVGHFLTLPIGSDGTPTGMTVPETEFWADELNSLFAAGSKFDALGKSIDAAIDNHLDPFAALTAKEKALVDRALRSSQLSISIAEKDPQQSTTAKTFVSELIYDQGLGPRWSGIGNLRYERPEGTVSNSDALVLSGSLRYVLIPSKHVKRDSYLDIAFDSTLRHEPKKYHAQVKWTLPLTSGIQIPLSITWANQRDLIKESEIRGQFGISWDLSNWLRR